MSYEPPSTEFGGRATTGTLSEAAPWSVVIPVKLLRDAKSRLSRLDPDDRVALALAMALDTVEAATAAAARVLVVTDDPVAAAAAEEIGAIVVADRPDAGLNPALAHGAAEAARRWPADGIAAVSADLPALRPGALREALAEAALHPRAFVADTSAEGTVVLTARGVDLEPEFGAGSAARHRGTGAVEVGASAVSLRRDVDTIEDLSVALALGCGPRTTRAAGRLGLPSLPAESPAPSARTGPGSRAAD